MRTLLVTLVLALAALMAAGATNEFIDLQDDDSVQLGDNEEAVLVFDGTDDRLELRIADKDYYIDQGTGDVIFSGDVGVNDVTPSYSLSVGSTDGSNHVGIYHDNSDAYITTDDGSVVVQTTEANTHGYLDSKGHGTGSGHLRAFDSDGDFLDLYSDANTNYLKFSDGGLTIQTDEDEDTITYLDVRGKGAQYGILRVFDQNVANRFELWCTSGAGYFATSGASPGALQFQAGAHANVSFFVAAASGETPECTIGGYRAGDSLRHLRIGCGVDAADTASFDGVSNYWFDGVVDLSSGNTYKINGTQIAASDLSDGANVAHINAAETLAADWVNTANPWADNEVADALTVSGGSVDNSAVGAVTPSTGAFTTCTASGVLRSSAVTTFGSADTTPSVNAGNLFKTVDETITITGLDDGATGQHITIIGQNSANTCDFSDAGTLKLSAAWTAAADATLCLVYDGTNWYEESRSAN